jgi:hypothetical protein
MRWLAAVLVLLTSPVTASPNGQDVAVARYHQQLARICPEKHLELLTDSALRSFQGNYIGKLPRTKRVALADIANRDTSCAPDFRDARCVNANFLRATVKADQLSAFLEMMCRLPIVCKPGSACNP